MTGIQSPQTRSANSVSRFTLFLLPQPIQQTRLYTVIVFQRKHDLLRLFSPVLTNLADIEFSPRLDTLL